MRISDWSTDVCSSDLDAAELQPHMRSRRAERPLVWTYPSGRKALLVGYTADEVVGMPRAEGRALLMRLLEWAAQRSEERRVGKEWVSQCRSLWSTTQ